MKVSEIEALLEVIEAAKVLQGLEANGLCEPVIASGWTRALLTDSTTSDIDVSYVGKVHFEDAQVILKRVLQKLEPSHADIWDIRGIWNAQIAYGVEHTVDNLLLYYVDSIDSVYLAPDGRLHDPTGFGFSDARSGILRLNMYDIERRPTTHSEEVNVCLEACRRMAKLDWKPTDQSIERIESGAVRWATLTVDEKTYFTRKLASKYTPVEVLRAQEVYEKYGWGFVFDEPDFTGRMKR